MSDEVQIKVEAKGLYDHPMIAAKILFKWPDEHEWETYGFIIIEDTEKGKVLWIFWDKNQYHNISPTEIEKITDQLRPLGFNIEITKVNQLFVSSEHEE
jgi:hypothetical protein